MIYSWSFLRLVLFFMKLATYDQFKINLRRLLSKSVKWLLTTFFCVWLLIRSVSCEINNNIIQRFRRVPLHKDALLGPVIKSTILTRSIRRLQIYHDNCKNASTKSEKCMNFQEELKLSTAKQVSSVCVIDTRKKYCYRDICLCSINTTKIRSNFTH